MARFEHRYVTFAPFQVMWGKNCNMISSLSAIIRGRPFRCWFVAGKNLVLSWLYKNVKSHIEHVCGYRRSLSIAFLLIDSHV